MEPDSWRRNLGRWKLRPAESDGGYVLVGQLWPLPRDQDYDARAIKTDPSGEEMWNRAFGTPERSEFALAVQETGDGGYLVAGGTEIASDDDSDCWLIQISTSGKPVWDKTYGGSSCETCTSLAPRRDGDCLLACVTNDRQTGAPDLWPIQTNADGNKMWERVFGGSKVDVETSIQATRDGGWIVTGFTESQGTEERDAWVVKLQ